MISHDPTVLSGLFCVAVIAAAFDAIAGGGGLLTVPALLLSGLNPVAAIATNKLQGFAGTASATIAFARKGLIDRTTALPIAASAAAASILGAVSVSLLPRPVLTALVPILLVAIAIYFALARKMSDEDRRARLSPVMFNLCIVPIVGFYDGIFGPGAGSFYMIGFVSLLGYGVIRATAHTKLANGSSNLGSLCFFAATGQIDWAIGLAMAFGALLGAQIGSALAMCLGARLIRPLIVVMSTLMAARLLYEPGSALIRRLVDGL